MWQTAGPTMWTAESANHMRCFLGSFADAQSHVKIQTGKLHAPDMALSSVTVSIYRSQLHSGRQQCLAIYE